MLNDYDKKLEICYTDLEKGVTEKVSLERFKYLFSNEMISAYEAFKTKNSMYREAWQRETLEVEFFQDLYGNFNNFTDSNIRIIGVY